MDSYPHTMLHFISSCMDILDAETQDVTWRSTAECSRRSVWQAEGQCNVIVAGWQRMYLKDKSQLVSHGIWLLQRRTWLLQAMLGFKLAENMAAHGSSMQTS